MEETQSVSWPALVVMAGDAELLYVADQRDWDAHNEPHHPACSEDDYLLDADGRVYRLSLQAEGHVVPRPAGVTRALVDVLGLVKAHAAQSGSCCVAKLYAASIRQAIELVRSVDEQ